MKNLNKKILVKDNKSKVESNVSVDVKLDKFKNVKFVSDKLEIVDKMVAKFEFAF